MVPDRLTLRSLVRATPGSAHYLYPRMTAIDDRAQASARMSEQGIEPAENRRKPGGQCLAACPPGLTADTTVFAIDGPAQMRLRRAGRQGIASRGVPCMRHLQPLAVPAFGGRFGFVPRRPPTCRPNPPPPKHP